MAIHHDDAVLQNMNEWSQVRCQALLVASCVAAVSCARVALRLQQGMQPYTAWHLPGIFLRARENLALELLTCRVRMLLVA